jgi:hypothetical protein
MFHSRPKMHMRLVDILLLPSDPIAEPTVLGLLRPALAALERFTKVYQTYQTLPLTIATASITRQLN